MTQNVAQRFCNFFATFLQSNVPMETKQLSGAPWPKWADWPYWKIASSFNKFFFY
jgi:hypothetical protein